MKTYYLHIYQNNTPSHYATIRSDWTDAEWEHLEETFPNGYFSSGFEKVYIKDIPKRYPNWREILPNFEKPKARFEGVSPEVLKSKIVELEIELQNREIYIAKLESRTRFYNNKLSNEAASRLRQKDIDKHRMYSDPDWNWSGLR
tara:strand:+ start:1916 stop:2350 length:435 start_codon:yes stop_codon:yes gene_type:complete